MDEHAFPLTGLAVTLLGRGDSGEFEKKTKKKRDFVNKMQMLTTCWTERRLIHLIQSIKQDALTFQTR